MSDEYNGWTNRETWAFWLHVTNDQGMYHETREAASSFLEVHGGASDRAVGEYVVDQWRELLEELETASGGLGDGLRAFRDDVGSWWRIDHAEIGAAARELVDEEE